MAFPATRGRQEGEAAMIIAGRQALLAAAALSGPACVARHPGGSDMPTMTAAPRRADHARFGAILRELEPEDS
jgi:hypothetical protein